MHESGLHSICQPIISIHITKERSQEDKLIFVRRNSSEKLRILETKTKLLKKFINQKTKTDQSPKTENILKKELRENLYRV
jgi:hypothetical protein